MMCFYVGENGTFPPVFGPLVFGSSWFGPFPGHLVAGDAAWR